MEEVGAGTLSHDRLKRRKRKAMKVNEFFLDAPPVDRGKKSDKEAEKKSKEMVREMVVKVMGEEMVEEMGEELAVKMLIFTRGAVGDIGAYHYGMSYDVLTAICELVLGEEMAVKMAAAKMAVKVVEMGEEMVKWVGEKMAEEMGAFNYDIYQVLRKVWVSLLKKGIFWDKMHYDIIRYIIRYIKNHFSTPPARLPARSLAAHLDDIIKNFLEEGVMPAIGEGTISPPNPGLEDVSKKKGNDDDYFFPPVSKETFRSIVHDKVTWTNKYKIKGKSLEGDLGGYLARVEQQEDEDLDLEELKELKKNFESVKENYSNFLYYIHRPDEHHETIDDVLRRLSETEIKLETIQSKIDSLQAQGGGDLKRKIRKKLKKKNRRKQKSKKYRKKTNRRKQKSKKSKKTKNR